MAKTNKEIRSGFAGELMDKFEKRNESLDKVNKSSFSEGLKEQMRKEIMENFYAEMNDMKKRPGYEEAKKTHLEEIKAKNRFNKAKKELEDAEKAYKEAQVAHRGNVENEHNISEDLNKYREEWNEEIKEISDESKEKIIKAAEKISLTLNEKIDSDGSRLIEFKLGNKTYKILDPKLKTHSDDKYKYGRYRDSKVDIDDTVCLGGMWGDDVEKWKNQKLKEYVKEKQGQGLHLPKLEEMEHILQELGKEAGLDDVKDEIAMLMYLTGMDGAYWLGSCDFKGVEDQDARSKLYCYKIHRTCDYDDMAADNASLCMIACE